MVTLPFAISRISLGGKDGHLSLPISLNSFKLEIVQPDPLSTPRTQHSQRFFVRQIRNPKPQFEFFRFGVELFG
jgi:hypothetical protein